MRKLFGLHFTLEIVMGMFWTCWVANLLKTGLSLQEACIAGAAWFIGIALFEIPTGYIADRFGRKASTIAGTLGLTGSLFLLGLFEDSSLGYLFLFCAGVSTTLISGAKDAWLYNRSTDLYPKQDSEAFWIKTQLIGRSGMIIGAFTGAYFTANHPELVWFTVGCLGIIGSCLGLFSKAGSTDCKIGKEAFEVNLPEKSKVNYAALIPILLATVFFGFEAGIRNMVFQPYILKLQGGEVFYLAWFQTSLSVARIAGILFYKHVLKHLNKSVGLAALSLLVFGLAEIVASFSTTYSQFIPLYLLAIFALGWFFPIKQTLLNNAIAEKSRATMISFDAMLEGLFAGLSCFILASKIDDKNLGEFWLWGGVSLVAAGLCFSGQILLQRSKQLKGLAKKMPLFWGNRLS